MSPDVRLCSRSLWPPFQAGHRPDSGARQVNPRSWFGAGGNASLQVLWEDGELVFCRRRGIGANGDRKSVLAALPALEHPTPDSLNRLAHEYGLKDVLDGAWAVQPGNINCSALKRCYRRIVIGDRPEVRLVYLRGGRDLTAEHLAGRRGHFIPASLLQSQFDTLEEPDPGEDPLTIDLGPPAGQVAEEIIRLLGASTAVGRNVMRPQAH
jgi:hypothetical protein